MVQDYVISPRIMGASVELHPLAALFGILAGGEIAGVLGVYLSIPVMASLAHRLAALANLRGEAQVWPAQRISAARNRARNEPESPGRSTLVPAPVIPIDFRWYKISLTHV